jgi:PAS domain S-box-containing protein
MGDIMSVTYKTTLGVVAIVFLVICIFSLLSILHVENSVNGAIEQKRTKIEYMLDFYSHQIERALRSNYHVMMSDYYIREVIASKDKENIRNYFFEKQKALSAEYNTDILIHIYDEQGNIFSGMTAPLNSNQLFYPREMIKDVANKHVPRYGFDTDCYGIYYRYAEPIYFLGVFVGIVEIGVSLDYLLSSMSRTLDLEMGIFIPVTERNKLCEDIEIEMPGKEILMNVSNATFIDIFRNSNNALDKESTVNLNDKYYRVHHGHYIKDYKGYSIADIVTFIDITKDKESVHNYVKVAVLLAVLFVALTVLLLKSSFVRLVKELEERYQESKLREYYLGNIITNSLNELYIYDIDTFDFLEVNKGAYEKLGYTQEQILEKTVLDIMPLISRSELVEILKPVIDDTKKKAVIETLHKRKDGTMYDVEIHVQKVVVRERAMLMALAIDSSLRKKAENELKRLNEALEKKVEHETERRLFTEKIMLEQKKFIDMGQMINAVAHQWRQPLNALGLYIQDIRDTYTNNNLDLDYVEQTEKDCMMIISHMSETIDDFRCFFAPGKKSEPFEVVKILIDTIRLVSAQLTASSINYRITCRCGDDCFTTENSVENPICTKKRTKVFGYEGEFKQVLLNLIHNAKDAITERRDKHNFVGGMIEFDIDACGENVILIVSDNGGGIPSYVIGSIFDPYFTTKEEGKGTGIGLYMSRNIVEQHMKGTITVKNDGDKAVFTIVLKPAGITTTDNQTQ